MFLRELMCKKTASSLDLFLTLKIYKYYTIGEVLHFKAIVYLLPQFTRLLTGLKSSGLYIFEFPVSKIINKIGTQILRKTYKFNSVVLYI